MALMTDFLENNLLNHTFRGSEYPSPKQVWLALLSADPTDEMHSNEIYGNGYKREPIYLDSPRNGLAGNRSKIIFDHATKAWVPITHVAIFDSEDGGQMMMHGAVEKPVTVTKNKNFVINLNDLQIGFE